MFAALLAGVAAGYGIAIPVGAIAILIVDMGLRRGFPPAFMAGAGAATADFIYALLAVIAGATLAAALAPYATALQIASAIVLLALGAYGLRQATQIDTGQKSRPTIANNQSLGRIYLRFLGLTILNPLTIAYFGALILGRDAGATVTTLDRLLFVLGAALASLSWQTMLAGLGSLANQRLSPRSQRLTSITGNLIVIALGLRILYEPGERLAQLGVVAAQPGGDVLVVPGHFEQVLKIENCRRIHGDSGFHQGNGRGVRSKRDHRDQGRSGPKAPRHNHYSEVWVPGHWERV